MRPVMSSRNPLKNTQNPPTQKPTITPSKCTKRRAKQRQASTNASMIPIPPPREALKSWHRCGFCVSFLSKKRAYLSEIWSARCCKTNETTKVQTARTSKTSIQNSKIVTAFAILAYSMCCNVPQSMSIPSSLTAQSLPFLLLLSVSLSATISPIAPR